MFTKAFARKSPYFHTQTRKLDVSFQQMISNIQKDLHFSVMRGKPYACGVRSKRGTPIPVTYPFPG